jgi:hypothetical protein
VECGTAGLALRVDRHVLAGPAKVREALVEEFVDLTTRRIATMLADRTAHGGE